MFGYVRKEAIEVRDGDSIWDVSRGEERQRKYRLIGYDSPEIGARAKSENEARWGEDATNHLREAINNSRSLRIWPRVFGQWHTRHGDRLAWLYIDGRDAKDIMVEARMGAQWTGGQRPRWDQMER